MTHPTHTHQQHGGRFLEVSEHAGTGPLEGQRLVIYHDLEKDVTSVTTPGDWKENWRTIAKDDCSVCLGTGHDHIKGNKAKPCGGCFGLGKVREDGKTPEDRWEMAEVAGKIIVELRGARKQIERRFESLEEVPGVSEARQAERERRKRQQEDAQAEQERQWRDGPGHGPGGRRHTGD